MAKIKFSKAKWNPGNGKITVIVVADGHSYTAMYAPERRFEHELIPSAWHVLGGRCPKRLAREIEAELKAKSQWVLATVEG